MVDAFSRHAIRVSVAQICQLIGWTSINSTPLEILTDILQEYISNLSKIAGNYAMLYGQSEPNMNHLALAFKDMGISVTELEEYITYVETSTVLEVPKYPIQKESHLNHLKPGSREVVTRPVHIHEHLPPMHPHLEDRDYILTKSPLSIDISPSDSLSPLSSPKSIFKKPGDPVCNDIRRIRPLLDDNEVRPLREISSVMMTTSGFLSPAREGKLPEARTQPIEFSRRSLSPENANLVEQNFDMKIEKKKKIKVIDVVKKIDKENSIKEEYNDQNETENEFLGKKLVNMKETSKLKVLKTGVPKIPPIPPSSSPIQKKPKLQLSPTAFQTNLIVKQPKEKSPKRDKKSISPPIKDLFIPTLSIPNVDFHTDMDLKLPTEPDKQRFSNFKKISRLKEDNDESKSIINEGHDNLFSFDPLSHISQLNRKVVNESFSFLKDCVDEMETHVDVEMSSPPCAFEFNRLPSPDLPKTPELPKFPEIKKKKKEKKEKKIDNDKDLYYNCPKIKNLLDDSFGKSKQSCSLPEVTFTEEEAQTPTFPALSCPVSPAPGLIPWSNPFFSNTNPTSPSLSLPNFSNFTKKSQEVPTTLQESSFSSTFASSASHTQSGTASLPSFANKDNSLISSKKKERKKEKKLKEKLKKKKDKKEKNKIKDKSERKKLKLEKKERAKQKVKKEKKEKKKEKEQASEERFEINTVPKITFKLGPVSPKDNSAESGTRKIVIKPIVKKEETENDAETNLFVPEIPKPQTSSNNPKVKSLKAGKSHLQTKPEILEKPTSSFSCAPVLSIPKPEPVSSIAKWDGDTNQLWICPACSRPDDGSPMIACDRCDYWYHWICVGIQEAIESDWYCQSCTSRRVEGGIEKKKKHRKKKT